VVGPPLNLGGWINISAIIGPVMVYFDRFLIGAMLSMAALSFYTVPFQVTGRLTILPGAMSGVLFAAFSGSFTRDPERAALIFERANRYVLLAVFTPLLLISTFAPEGLSLWLGPSFAANSTVVMRWFVFAMFISCLAWNPFGLIEAAHRPDLTAKLRVAELPCYAAALLWMLPRYGIEGAAVAYTARTVADTTALFVMARRLMPLAASAVNRLAILACAALAVVAAAAIPTDLASRCSLASVSLTAFAAVAWTCLLQSEEKDLIRGSIRHVVKRPRNILRPETPS
jgi:O-antigen/teichoic acid export membrane protein